MTWVGDEKATQRVVMTCWVGTGVVGQKKPPNESLRLVGWCREVMGWGTGVVGPKKPPNESKRLVGGVGTWWDVVPG